MLTSTELQKLLRELADTRVLSVYLDTGPTDPAMRHAWRATLTTGLREARQRIADANERDEFDRAAARLEESFPKPEGAWGPPGWAAFVTAEASHYVGDLPVHPSSLVVWRDGPVIAPYLRALKQHRPVIVALVDSRSARLYRYVGRQVESLEELTAPASEPSGAERITAPATGAASVPAARGAVGTDEAQRKRQSAFQRLAASLNVRITQLAGDSGWVVIGGTPEWAHVAAAALPRNMAARTLVVPTLAHDAHVNEIGSVAKQAATELRGAMDGVLVDQLIEDAGAGARAAVDVAAVQRALRSRAVDALLLSPQFIRRHEAEAEDLVRAAIASGADVEVPSGVAAERLDQAVSGVAARLRFPIGEAAHSADATDATAGHPRP